MGSAVAHFDHFMRSGPPLALWIVTLFLVVPPVTLLHEAGHALAARLRLTGRVRIRLGREPARPLCTVAGVEIHLGNLLQPFGITGVCEYEGAGVTAADAFAIALAGPVATAVGLTAAIALLGFVPPQTFAHALVWQATMAQGVSLILTLTPLTVSHRGRPQASDGAIAIDAVRRGALQARPVTAVHRVAPVARTPTQAPPVSADSPLCGGCGHRRDEHVDVVTGRRGACLGQDFDFQMLAATPCACTDYVHGFPPT